MKKILVALLVLSVAIGAVSASDGRIGVSISPEWFWNNTGDSGVSSGSTNFSLMAEGANYFGKKGGLGIEYGLGVTFPLNTWVEGSDPINVEDAPSSFIFKAGVGYRHEFSDLFGISAGVGINGKFQSRSYTVLGSEVSGNAFILGMYGDVMVDITLLEFLRINVGVMVGGPVYSAVNGSIGNIDIDMSDMFDTSGFSLAPVVALSFAY